MGGLQHPEIINILTRIAGVFKSMGDYKSAALCLVECHLRMQTSGDQISHAMVLQNLADVQMLDGSDKDAVIMQKEAYALISQIFGPTDERTLDAKSTLEKIVRQSTEKAVAAARKKQAEEQIEKDRQKLNWLDENIPNPIGQNIKSTNSKKKKAVKTIK
jgi:hypothetical protein